MMIDIEIYECAQCNQKYVQRKWICPNCHHITFHQKKVKGEGKVFSFTKIHVSSKGFAHLTPYIIVLIDLSERIQICILYNNHTPLIKKLCSLPNFFSKSIKIKKGSIVCISTIPSNIHLLKTFQ